METGPLVDAHFHLFGRDMPMEGDAWHEPTADGSAEAFLKVMDGNGVGFGIVTAASVYGDYNDYSIRSLRSFPRLRATASVRPDVDFYTLERLKADGVVGIRLFFLPGRDPPDVSSSEYSRLFHRVRDLDWHVQVLAQAAALPDIIRATDQAGVKLVVDHFGLPDPGLGAEDPGFEAMLTAIERGRTWVKVSASYRLTSMPYARTLADALVAVGGGERLLWGSDWPFFGFEGKVTYADTMASFRQLIPDEVLRHKIAGDTPMRLYFSG